MSSKRIGATMSIAAMAGVIGLLAWLFSDRLAEQRNPNRQIERMTAPDGAAAVVLQRNRFGHYVANGEINDVSTELMLDTGATDVAVSEAVARAAGLERGPGVTVATANGLTRAYVTVIERLRLGDITEHDVRATIVPNLDGTPVLLGMSFLQRLDFSQSGDRLVLKSRRAAAAPQEPL